MNEVKGEIHIDAPAEKVWQVISDLAEVQNYADSVARSYYTSSERVGTGAARHCDLLSFGTVDEVITEWEEGRRYVYSIESGGRCAALQGGILRMGCPPGQAWIRCLDLRSLPAEVRTDRSFDGQAHGRAAVSQSHAKPAHRP